MQKIRVLLLITTPVIFSACHKKYASDIRTTQIHFVETGLAFFYTHKFIVRPITIGQLYEPNKLKGAYRLIAFGTRVTITNYQNGKAVKLVINDKEPFFN